MIRNLFAGMPQSQPVEDAHDEVDEEVGASDGYQEVTTQDVMLMLRQAAMSRQLSVLCKEAIVRRASKRPAAKSPRKR